MTFLLTLQAKLAEEAERYDDMVVNVKSLAELQVQLNVEVRTWSPDFAEPFVSCTTPPAGAAFLFVLSLSELLHRRITSHHMGFLRTKADV